MKSKINKIKEELEKAFKLEERMQGIINNISNEIPKNNSENVNLSSSNLISGDIRNFENKETSIMDELNNIDDVITEINNGISKKIDEINSRLGFNSNK